MLGNLDSSITIFLYQFGERWRWIWGFVSLISSKGLEFVALSLWLILKPGKKNDRRFSWFALIGLSFFSLVVVDIVVKSVFGRMRPFEVLSDVKPIYFYPTSGSFPSGHAFSTMATAWLFGMRRPKWFWYLIVFSILAGVSRIFLGLHFLSDVLAGWAVGGVVGWSLNNSYCFVSKYWEKVR